MSGPGCQVLYRSEMGGEGRKQSKKTIQSLQMSPGMASLRQENVLVSVPYSPSQLGCSDYLPEADPYIFL